MCVVKLKTKTIKFSLINKRNDFSNNIINIYCKMNKQIHINRIRIIPNSNY